MTNRLRAAVLILVGLALSGCGGSGGGSGPVRAPFTYAIDASLTPAADILDDPVKGPRPVAATADANGVVSLFIENEVFFSPKSDSELDDFVARYGGEILESDAVPDPPPGLGRVLTAEEKKATSYLIRLDPSAFPLDNFISDAEAAGFGGDRKISSDAAARLYALIMKERKDGHDAGPNYLFTPQAAIVNHTEETDFPSGGAPIDAFNWNGLPYSHTLQDGDKSDVVAAWQFILAHGIARRVNLAIIDGGFWLDSTGSPMIAPPGTQSDFPPKPYQYDFRADDYVAAGGNSAGCTGGTDCPWHGNNCAAVATGIPDNQYGTAGTGGWVADPFLFRVDYTRAETVRAVRTAKDWGVDVVSMSFTGSCGIDCGLMLTSTYLYFQEAMAAKIVLVAAAGNDNFNIDNDSKFPCSMPGQTAESAGVLCVGALEYASSSRIGYSNYGKDVDIFAPTNIIVMPNGGTNGGLDQAGGTSASTPFIAGIVAMMKAIKPDATNKEIQDALKNTAWTDSADSTVPRYVNAYEAVKEIAGHALPADTFEPNNDASQAKHVDFGYTYDPITLSGDFDFYKFTLDDYYSLDLSLDYFFYLDEPKLNWVGGSFPAVQSSTETPDGKTIHEDLLPPGDYTFLLSGGFNHYHMKLIASHASLQPDVFEVNDTLETAAAPPTGSYPANRHTASDDDYYVYSAFGLDPPGKIFAFEVTQSDRPVTLSYYKNGTFVAAFPASTSPAVILSEDATYTFRITGSQTTRYAFRAGNSIDPSVFQFAVPVDWIPVIDVTGGNDHVLVGQEDLFAFQATTAVLGRYGGMKLTGGGLKLSLLDTEGNVVSEGVDVSGRVAPGQELAFTGVLAGGTYLLLVERTDTVAVPDAVLPLIQYGLNFQSF